ncbi:MAG: NAD(P)H-dependent glycerol-3-phosphate dehydrogenase [Amphiplicatus sp.]
MKMRDGAPFSVVSVIGGGAWGTALAHLAASNGSPTMIWAREREVAEAINQNHENRQFLPGVALDHGLRASAHLEDAARAEAFLFVVPTQHSRIVMRALAPLARDGAPVALCSKGIEQTTGMLLADILAEEWPCAVPAILSGPSFARDVALGLPTAVTLAVTDPEHGARWAATIGAPHFRPYLTDDLLGAELGGAVKNVLAIAAGAVEGRGLGESAKAAVIARGFAEFQRLGVALGAKRETMAGLSGLGDLILTATSKQSRNMSLGFELGQGQSLHAVLAERNSVSEGVATAGAVVELGRRAGVDLPICAAVADLVAGGRSIDDIIVDLLARPLKQEGA